MNEFDLNLEPFFSDNRKTVSMTQNIIDDINIPLNDVRYSRSRIRKFLNCHGMKGVKLKAELDRITYGYKAALIKEHLKTGATIKDAFASQSHLDKKTTHYPYGWPKKSMTRLMKRMFHGYGKKVFPVVVDEAYMLLE